MPSDKDVDLSKPPRLNPKRYATGIYAALEQVLRESSKPLTCVDLLTYDVVRQWTADANKLSNCLGHMWRKRLLKRHTAPASDLSMARYAYSWLGNPDTERVVPLPKQFMLEIPKRQLKITQVPNGVTLEHDTFTITIKLKP